MKRRPFSPNLDEIEAKIGAGKMNYEEAVETVLVLVAMVREAEANADICWTAKGYAEAMVREAEEERDNEFNENDKLTEEFCEMRDERDRLLCDVEKAEAAAAQERALANEWLAQLHDMKARVRELEANWTKALAWLRTVDDAHWYREDVAGALERGDHLNADELKS